MHFGDRGSEDVFEGHDTRAARKVLPKDLWGVARRKLDMLAAATGLSDLRMPPGNRLEKLRGDLTGRYSIRINDRFRIVFAWEDGRGATDVRIVDYH
jgi:proteic killer suppression protein